MGAHPDGTRLILDNGWRSARIQGGTPLPEPKKYVSDVMRLLAAAYCGNRQVAAELLPIVSTEL